MTISIVTCPNCNAMVLSDAARCHLCNHVLDQSRVDDSPAPSLPSDNAVAEDLATCPTCGESCRSGMVRCWNCGSFTRDEIRAAYDQLVASHASQVAESVNLPEVSPEQQAAEEHPRISGPWRSGSAPVAGAYFSADSPQAGGGDEFELAASDEDFTFELADSIQLTDAVEVPDEAEPTGGYRLAATPVDELDVIPQLAAEPPMIAETVESEPPLPISLAAESPVADEPPLPKASARKAEEPAVPHSEATAGDVLLEIAKSEEVDIARSRKSYRNRVKSGFLVYCPIGCRIRVQEKHRGRAGKCPKCGAMFFVPKMTPKSVPESTSDGQPAAVATAPVDKWRGLMEDVSLHTVVPQKLRIKPDSLVNDFQAVDLLFSDEGLLVVTLVTSAGLFGANNKKKPALRAAILEHLKTKGVEGLPAPASRFIPKDQLSQLAMAQPSPPDVESLFGNIPVFGGGRIAVKLPRIPDDLSSQYLSFALSGFRELARHLDSICGMAGLGANSEVPLSDSYNTVKCHYSDATFRDLQSLDYYRKDPSLKLQVNGWRCGGCGLVVSEDSRKKEKIGGLNGKGIAKAKCPKCAAKFGENPIYEVAATPAPVAAETAAAPA